MKKVAMIVGGRSPRALSLAQGLAEAGFDVVIQHEGTAAWAREAARRVESIGRRAHLVAVGEDDPATMAEAMRQVKSACGRLDVLVNAGCRAANGYASAVTAVGAAAPHLAAVAGCVVNVLDDPAAGGADRDALLRLTRGMVAVLSPGVRVNAVVPPDPTDAGDEVGYLAHADPPGGPEELLRAVLFVLGSPHLNGEMVVAGDPRRGG